MNFAKVVFGGVPIDCQEIVQKTLLNCVTRQITVTNGAARDAGVVYSEMQGSKYATSSRWGRLPSANNLLHFLVKMITTSQIGFRVHNFHPIEWVSDVCPQKMQPRAEGGSLSGQLRILRSNWRQFIQFALQHHDWQGRTEIGQCLRYTWIQQVRAYHRDFYRPENLLLTITYEFLFKMSRTFILQYLFQNLFFN